MDSFNFNGIINISYRVESYRGSVKCEVFPIKESLVLKWNVFLRKSLVSKTKCLTK